MENQQQQATQDHCLYCFDVIYAVLKKQQKPKFPDTIPDTESPLFVTWHINGDELRGCIGTFSSQAIKKNLSKYAQISAFEDTRFSPIQLDELPNLNVAVSLLVNFEKDKKYDEWIVGKHGIIIDFEDQNEQYNATYLPEVAAEQQWDILETLKSLIKKAGYKKNYKNVIEKISLTTYESSKFTLTYQDWFQIRSQK